MILSSMESEPNLDHKTTEQLINGMMSFLDEPTEHYKQEDFDESKHPLCAGIKNIIGLFPAPPPLRPPLHNLNTSFQRHRENHKTFSNSYSNFEKVCRHKDPYMQEVNRVMFCSTMGHPTNGSPEYFQAAEKYALHGKEFLDFPTEIKSSRSMDLNCLDGYGSTHPLNSLPKLNSSQGFGLQTGNYPNLGNTSPPQQPVMMNPTNYWGYPCYQSPNLVQPLMYSNPFLMTQYLNMVVRETQINTSIVQQHQFLFGGFHERLVYAQMLQQQIQTNQAAQANFSSISGSLGTGVGKSKVSLEDVKKIELNQVCNESDFIKSNLRGNTVCESNLDLKD